MFPADAFGRQDTQEDGLFYTQPRKLVHIDERAIASATKVYRQYLPETGAILDLMSSWRSHLPPERPYARVAGLGMNAEEMADNPQLSDYLVHDLNRDPQLPYDDATFDGAVCTVSVQYLTSPVAVFAEIGRVLRPGAPAIITFSNRMFPTKAVAIWCSLSDADHCSLVATYFAQSGAFAPATALDASQRRGDPLYAVIAHTTIP